MSDNSDNINFSVAEKCSYVGSDENGPFAKISKIAEGPVQLVDPLNWSYAETHSYVKIDPKNVGFDVPSSVTDLYAKVIFSPMSNSSDSSNQDNLYAKKTDVEKQINDLIEFLDMKLNSIKAENNFDIKLGDRETNSESINQLNFKDRINSNYVIKFGER